MSITIFVGKNIILSTLFLEKVESGVSERGRQMEMIANCYINTFFLNYAVQHSDSGPYIFSSLMRHFQPVFPRRPLWDFKTQDSWVKTDDFWQLLPWATAFWVAPGSNWQHFCLLLDWNWLSLCCYMCDYNFIMPIHFLFNTHIAA